MSELLRKMLQARHPPLGPTPSEAEFFERTGTPGYAADDGSVVMSDKTLRDPGFYESLSANEAARIEMRKNGDFFTFPLEPHQQQFFQKHSPEHYAKDSQAARQTIAARIIAGDPSAAPYTPAQQAAAHWSAGKMIGSRQ